MSLWAGDETDFVYSLVFVKKENENRKSDTNDLEWPRVVEFVAYENDDAMVRDFVKEYLKEESPQLDPGTQIKAIAHIYTYVLVLTHFWIAIWSFVRLFYPIEINDKQVSIWRKTLSRIAGEIV